MTRVYAQVRLRMRLARFLPLLLALTIGCAAKDASVARSDTPEHHRHLADALVALIAKSYPEFESLPDNEHLVRYLHAYSRDMHSLLSAFIEENPTDDPELLNAMHELDDVAMRELQLHATLIAEGRFDYTESEADLAKDLRERSAALAGIVAGFVAP